MTDFQAWIIIGLLVVITVLLLIIAVSTYAPGVLRTIWLGTIGLVVVVGGWVVFLGIVLAIGWALLKAIFFGP